jgi:hypothetical protein
MNLRRSRARYALAFVSLLMPVGPAVASAAPADSGTGSAAGTEPAFGDSSSTQTQAGSAQKTQGDSPDSQGPHEKRDKKKDESADGGISIMASSLFYVGVTSAGPAGDGYWSVTDGGVVTPLREAPDDPLPTHYGEICAPCVLNAPIVGIAGRPAGGGYWLAASDGGIFSYGSAGFYGSLGGMQLNAPIVGIAATPSGSGYWLVARDGGVFTFGNAPYLGGLGGQGHNDVVAMAVTPSGNGYWLLRASGAVHSFGDAPYRGGSTNGAFVSMAATKDGQGYWLLRNALGANNEVFGEVQPFNAPWYGNGSNCCGFLFSALIAKRGVHSGYAMQSKNNSHFAGFEPNQVPIGNVDENNHIRVRGWTLDPNTTTRSIEIQIKVDGIEQYRQATPVHRADVNVAYSGISGNHGFDWVVPSWLHDARPHTVEVFAVDSGGAAPPLGSTLLNRTTWTSPNLNPLGAIDEISGNRVVGWVADGNAPGAVTVRIYVSDASGVFPSTPTASVAADQVRGDPPAANGFAWAVPVSFADGKERKVQVRALDYPTNAETTIGDPTAGFVRLDDGWGANGGASSSWDTGRWSTTTTNSTRIVDVTNSEGRLQLLTSSARATAKTPPIADSDATFTYRFESTSARSYLRPMLRAQGATGSNQMQTGYRVEIRSDSTTIRLQSYVNGTSAPLGSFTYNPDGQSGPDPGSHRLRFHVQGTRIRVKVWPAAKPEPASWQIDVPSDTSITGTGVLQINHNYSDGPNTVYIDDLSLASAAPPKLRACAGVGPVEASTLPPVIPADACDLRDRVVLDHGAGGYAPAPGEVLHADLYMVDGSEELVIRTLASGTVELASVGSERSGSAATPGAPTEGGSYEPGDKRTARDPCLGGGAPPNDGVESDTRAWYLNLDDAPPILGTANADQVEQAFLLGDRLFRQGNTQCSGYAGFVDIPTSYKGRTTKDAEINRAGNCAMNRFTRDRNNVVSFGPIDKTGTLAVTCRLTTFGNEITEADIRFQTEVNWFANLTPECSDHVDLVGVMVHETGHVYGFGHVKEGDDPDAGSMANWTMSPRINGRCEMAERTLAGAEVSEISAYY